MRGTRELWEAFERKHNPSDTREGRAAANQAMAKTVIEAIEKKKLAWRDISFRELFEETFERPHREDVIESFDTSAFPIITGQLITKKIIDAYEQFPKIGDQLVTVIPGVTPDEDKVPGFTTVGTLKTVAQNEAYQYMDSPAEKYKRVTKIKRGGLLAVTEEVIKYDQTGQFLSRCGDVGIELARDREERICKGVLDIDSNVYDKAALYASPSALSGAGGTNANAYSGSDTDLGTGSWEQIEQKLMEMTDDRSRPIWVFGDRPLLMVPPRLKARATKMKLSEHGDLGTANLDVNLAKDAFDVIVNPYFPTLTSSTRWLYGSFKRQFVWVEDIPLQVMQRSGQMTELGWHNDIVQEFKVRYKGGIGAVDTKFVINMAGA